MDLLLVPTSQRAATEMRDAVGFCPQCGETSCDCVRRVGGCRGCGDADGTAVACAVCRPPRRLPWPAVAPVPADGGGADDDGGSDGGDESVDPALVGLGMGRW